MHSPAHKRFFSVCASLRVRRSLTPFQVLTLLVGFQQHQSVLVKKNHFFVLVLGFDAGSHRVLETLLHRSVFFSRNELGLIPDSGGLGPRLQLFELRTPGSLAV